MPAAPLLSAVVLVCSVGALWVGANLFVDNAARLARRVGLSDLVVGLTVVAMGTSAPEVAVSVDAALVDNGDIAVANVVGSNLFNIGLVLGGIAVVARVRSSPAMVRRDAAVMVGSAALLLGFLWDLTVTRLEGIVLLVLFGAYLALLFARPGQSVEPPSPGDRPGWSTPVIAVGGAALIGVGAHFLVESAVVLARFASLSEWVIGETIVAVGTSTPEIVASVGAARKGMGDVAAGNLIGSNVFNALLVLGVTATLSPIEVAGTALGTTTWLVGLSALTAVLLGTRGVLGRVEGAVLVVLNLIRWGLDLL